MIKRKYLPFLVFKLLAITVVSILLALLTRWLFSIWIALLIFTPIASLTALLFTVDWLKDTITITDQYALVRSRTMGFFGERLERVYLNTITEPKTDKGFIGLILKVGWIELQTGSDRDTLHYGPVHRPNEIVEYIDEVLRGQAERASAPATQGNRIILVPEEER